jgi:hypothetical protein
VKEDLRFIDDAVAQNAIDTGGSSGDGVETDDGVNVVDNART